jgi:hypothetical protein
MSDDQLPTPDKDKPQKTYSDFTQSGFFTWFNLSETKKEKNSFDQWTVWLKPGAHQAHIDIIVMMDVDERIWSAALSLKRAWMKMGNGHNPMAIDITQSFIANMLMPGESDEAKPVVEALWASLRANPGMPMIVREESNQPPAASSPALTEFVRAYLGKRPEASLNFSQSALFANNKFPDPFINPHIDHEYILLVSTPVIRCDICAVPSHLRLNINLTRQGLHHAQPVRC